MRKREKARPQVLRKFCPAFRAEEPWQLLPQAEPPPGCNSYHDIMVMMMAIFLLFMMTMTMLTMVTMVTMVISMVMTKVMMMISHRTGPVKTRDTNCCHKMQEHLRNNNSHHHHI